MLKQREWTKEQGLAFFQDLHRNPELSGEEVRTTEQIRAVLTAYNIEILDLPLKTGLVAQIGSGQEPIVALRCDIDALPVDEKSGLPYASETEGTMHACGHDFHTTTVLTTALLMKARQSAIPGTVRFIFQPAEEINRGAMQVLETKALDDVEAIFGIHCSPDLPVGTIGLKNGAVTAAVDRFFIRIFGKGGHAATPHGTLDPIVAAGHLVTAAQSIVARRIDPFHSAVLSFTRIAGGQTWNVIPDEVVLEGTVRSHDRADRELIQTRLEALCQSLALAHEMKVAFEWEAGPPATDNQAELVSLAREQALHLDFEVRTPIDSMIGEDFAYYMETIAGCFIMVGTGLSAPLHNPTFEVDPQAIRPTALLLQKIVEAYFSV